MRVPRTTAGFSLAEALVATALLLTVMSALYQVFWGSMSAYRLGTGNADAQQRTRVAFETMLAEISLAGFDYDRDGQDTEYPQSPDEQIEYLAEHAIAFRANLDTDEAGAGREPSYEIDSSDPDWGLACCPVVTTANDEIVVYALRSDDSAANDDSIVFQADLSMPRDAEIDTLTGLPTDEETITVAGVDLDGDTPPYSLYRFTFLDDGSILEQVISTDLRTMTLAFFDASDDLFYCKSRETDGSCSNANQVPFLSVAGADDLDATEDQERREARAAVRRIGLDLIGLTEHDDLKWNEPTENLLSTRRRVELATVVTASNLGLRGAADLEAIPAIPPENVTVCVGQCDTIRVEWDESEGASAYVVNLYLTGQADPFLTENTPGVLVQGTDPQRQYAVYDRRNDPTIAIGAEIFAAVQSRTGRNTVSAESDPSTPATIVDLVRPEAPTAVIATGYDPTEVGWPAVEAAVIAPDTAGSGLFPAEANAITIYWEPPIWTLDVTDQSAPAGSWTTILDASTLAALDCDTDQADIDGDGTKDKPRTRCRELFGEDRYLIFRSEDEQFVPADGDLVAEVAGNTALNGMLKYVDSTEHVYSEGIFNRTNNAVVNCTTYYYRVRAVDACWDGTAPASRSGSMNLSPFYPPLNVDPTTTDSDDVSGVAAALVGPAIPGYAVPSAAPAAPTDVRFTDHDTDATDGDDFDALVSFDAVKADSGSPPVSLAVSKYLLYSHATNPSFSLSDARLGMGGTTLEATIPIWDVEAGRIAYDDEDGSGSVSSAEDESDPPAVVLGSPHSGLRIDLPADGSSRWWRLTAVQCEGEFTIPSGDPTEWDLGPLSTAVYFPCDFGGGSSSTIVMDASDFDNSVTATATVADVNVPAEYARLILVDPDTGDRAISDVPGVTVDASGLATFDAAHISALTNNFGTGTYDIFVEMVDSAGCYGFSDSERKSGGLGLCCMSGGDPTQDSSGSTTVADVLTETCSGGSLQISEIFLEVDNATGRTFERMESVSWGSEELWTGNAVRVTIDRSADPLILDADGVQSLTVLFGRDPEGDNLTINYTYRTAGSPGECNFTGAIHP